MSLSPLNSLARTAYFTAAARAQESERADALFIDPWAAQLAGESGFDALNRLPAISTLWPIVRTRFLDDCLLQWGQEGRASQIVLLAAGLDTRAYRLTWSTGTRVFEIDQPSVLDDKARVLAQAQATPRCECITVGVDLRHAWAERLIQAGFVPESPSIWIVEGFLMYLDPETTQHIMETIARLACSGSCLGIDVQSPSLQGFQIDDPRAWLAEWGWNATVSTLSETVARFGRRPSPSPADLARRTQTRVYFINAQRR